MLSDEKKLQHLINVSLEQIRLNISAVEAFINKNNYPEALERLDKAQFFAEKLREFILRLRGVDAQ